MSVYFFCFDEVDPLGHTATHPSEPLATRLGALLLLAGSSCASSLRLPRRAASGPLGRFQLRMKSCRLTGSRWTVPWPSRRAIRAVGQICSYDTFVIPAQAGIQTAPDSGLRVIDGKSTTWRKNKFALIRAALHCNVHPVGTEARAWGVGARHSKLRWPGRPCATSVVTKAWVFSSRPLEYTSGIVCFSDRHCGSSWSKLPPCCPLRTRQTENPSISLRKHVDESNA